MTAGRNCMSFMRESIENGGPSETQAMLSDYIDMNSAITKAGGISGQQTRRAVVVTHRHDAATCAQGREQ